MRTAQRKKFTLVHDLGGSVHHGGKSVAKHSYSILEARIRTGNAGYKLALSFPHFIPLGFPAHGMVPPYAGRVFPPAPQPALFGSQACCIISQVILKLAKLTLTINQHTGNTGFLSE